MEHKTALITGASGGIGREIAYELAELGYDILAVARSKDNLVSLKKSIEEKYSVSVAVLPCDMTKENAAEKIAEKLADINIDIDLLVNNAGFGDNGAFLDSDWEKQKRMMKLNIAALVQMTYVFGNKMKERKNGKILNVASCAAFSAGPYMSMYYATKNFVLAFSEALYEELKEYGITVTALCPGPTATDFEKNADMNNSVMFSIFKPADAKSVAHVGVKALMKGKCVKYHGFVTKGFNIISRIVPRKLSRTMAKGMNRIKSDNNLSDNSEYTR